MISGRGRDHRENLKEWLMGVYNSPELCGKIGVVFLACFLLYMEH